MTDTPANTAAATSMVEEALDFLFSSGTHFSDECVAQIDADDLITVKLDNGNGVVIRVEYVGVDDACGLCPMRAKFMVIPDTIEDNGTVQACERHLDEIAGQYSRPEIQPIQVWRHH